MPCQVNVDTEVKTDILDCDDEARQQIGDFLLALQEDPLPEQRRPMAGASFYVKLPCGYFVGWEVLGDLMAYATTGKTKGLTVRILGVGFDQPK